MRSMRPSRLIHEKVALRDGRTVVLRPIDPSDAERLIDLHNHLSFESQYFRFFGPKPQLTPAEAEYLANVDFHRRFAIVAEVDGHEIIGVGRFDVNEPGIAEAAVVVRDDYQHVGLGTALLQRMREVARGAGLKSFTAEVLAENNRMLDLLQSNGLEVAEAEQGVVRVIAPIENQPILFRGLKVAAEVAGAILPKRPG
jgi:GNAT superfamily N-acetyltransferase